MSFLIAILSLLGTIAIFYISKMFYKKYKKEWLTPILITPLVIIIILLLTGTSYKSFNAGANILTNLLGPATVAFAVPIYKNFNLLKKHAFEIFLSIAVGSAVAITSSFIIAVVVGLNDELVHSLVPRSVTTPIAMDISNMIGGSPTLTAVFVMATGILGSLIAPLVIKVCRFHRPSSRGLMLGMGAHGTGTSKAFEFGELEGTFASLAMIVAALISIVLTTTFFPALEHLVVNILLP
ncbi:LrgB family protein [Lysinibacillus agricola]|uniref:LrgB family protein n=1 Tax=Lysinibacillus agricola TaxID=2590012 RepID=A0ABX7AP71_9BACI|nr:MULTISPECIES: LrgB family protein [Lysinibacillus]KOS64787.1 murein hydrolase effector protein [Lysinibacillus sp. FJAT-14222]QQP11743.1 LrgB family protein [Lysinibacillus agricola]